jgi:hypothetical protein
MVLEVSKILNYDLKAIEEKLLLMAAIRFTWARLIKNFVKEYFLLNNNKKLLML